MAHAPVSYKIRAQLERRLHNIHRIAKRDGWDTHDVQFQQEQGQQNFELAMWCYWLSRRRKSFTVSDRARLVLAVLSSGKTSIENEFLIVFNFSERSFDAIFEMGDGDEVVEAISHLVHASNDPVALKGLRSNGWDRATASTAFQLTTS